jgi:hypothetical protein
VSLRGAVIRDKASGTVWRVVEGERMWHVQRALARAIEYGKGHAYYNAVRRDERGPRPDKVLALVVRIVGPWAASV